MEALMAIRRPRSDFKASCTRAWTGIIWAHSVDEFGICHDWDSLVDAHTGYRIDGRIVSEGEYKARYVQRKGVKFMPPLTDVGFHLGVEFAEIRNNGFKPVIRVGRQLDSPGVHTGVPGHFEYEARYLGFVAIGNFDTMPVRPEMLDLCLRVTRTFMDTFNIKPDNVLGGHEAFEKHNLKPPATSPGILWNMQKFRADL
jgi:hypothetical protein